MTRFNLLSFFCLQLFRVDVLVRIFIRLAYSVDSSSCLQSIKLRNKWEIKRKLLINCELKCGFDFLTAFNYSNCWKARNLGTFQLYREFNSNFDTFIRQNVNFRRTEIRTFKLPKILLKSSKLLLKKSFWKSKNTMSALGGFEREADIEERRKKRQEEWEKVRKEDEPESK